MEDPSLDSKPVDMSVCFHWVTPKATLTSVDSVLALQKYALRRISGFCTRWTSLLYGAYVFPLAGKPTVMMTIRPEWNSLPDSVLYSWAGASSTFSGRSWIASTKVLDFLRNRGELATTSAVLYVVRNLIIAFVWTRDVTYSKVSMVVGSLAMTN